MGKLTWLGIGLAALFWFVDAAVDAFLGEGRVVGQILDPEPLEVWARSFVGVLFVAFGAYAQRTVVVRREAEEALRELARRDPLTGALNRRAVKAWLDGLCEAGDGPLAVAVADIDGMKAANDTWGHQVGDALLCTVVEALSREGAIVGRYGGDEFVVVLPEADREAAHRYASEVLRSLREDTVVVPETGTRVAISITIGLAIYPDDAESTDGLIKAADDAMYEARRSRSSVRAGSERSAA